MPRHRLPPAKAEAAGAALINPGRFANRKTAKRISPLGDPYSKMSDGQKQAWEEFRAELPWLNSSHRSLVAATCMLHARVVAGEEVGVTALQALSSLLSKLGATPVDETRVNHAADPDEDPSDKFFGRPN